VGGGSLRRQGRGLIGFSIIIMITVSIIPVLSLSRVGLSSYGITRPELPVNIAAIR